jgi:hypothetical protein
MIMVENEVDGIVMHSDGKGQLLRSYLSLVLNWLLPSFDDAVDTAGGWSLESKAIDGILATYAVGATNNYELWLVCPQANTILSNKLSIVCYMANNPASEIRATIGYYDSTEEWYTLVTDHVMNPNAETVLDLPLNLYGAISFAFTNLFSSPGMLKEIKLGLEA